MAKSSLQEKLAKRRQEIKDRSAGGSVVFIKEGTLRIRIKPFPEDEDWAVETSSFYLGGDIKGVFSRETIGEDCPIMEKYEELKNSKKPGDMEIAKRLSPRKKYLVAAVVYSDERGKEINEKDSTKLVQLPTGIYTQLIDFFLDPDVGDFTDPDEGYDLKIKRTGKGKQDTEYTLIPLPRSKVPTAYRQIVDPMDVFKDSVMLSYEDCENKLAQFLVDANATEDEDEEEVPKKRVAKKRPRRRK